MSLQSHRKLIAQVKRWEAEEQDCGEIEHYGGLWWYTGRLVEMKWEEHSEGRVGLVNMLR